MKSIVELQNFTTDEMSCNCDRSECTAKVASRAKIAIQMLRYLVDESLQINRSCSCKEHNASEAVKGKAGSKHVPENCEDHSKDQKGSDGFDIQTNARLTAKILVFAPFLGFYGIGIGDTKIHIDMRPFMYRATWTY